MITEKHIHNAMTYPGSCMEETLHVAGYEIEIHHDSDCMNPYDWDGMSPAIWIMPRDGFIEYAKADIESFFGHVTDSWVSRHWRAIAGILDLDQSEHDQEARELAKDSGDSLSGARSSLFIDALHDMRAEPWGYGTDYLETLRALYRLAGIPAETYQRNGYCQGDSVYGLIVMTPTWAETVGAPHAKPGKIDMGRCESDMAAQADEYGQWCFGDCYGYSITDSTGADVDSCWGFIGSDPDKSGMMDSILSAINYDIQDKRKARAKRVKEMIRNRVPLSIRAQEIHA